MAPADLRNRFEFHPGTPDTVPVYGAVRALCLALAGELDNLAPDCREKSLAITRLEEVMFWTNAAVARN